MKHLSTVMLVLAVVLSTQVSLAQIGDVKVTGDLRVKQLLDKAELKYDVDKDGDFNMINQFNNKRTQLLFINSNTEKFQNMEIREIWSVGYRPDGKEIPAQVATKLLHANAKIKLGAWQVITLNGKEHAVFCAKIAAETKMKTLLGVLQLVSEAADEMEAELTKKDDL